MQKWEYGILEMTKGYKKTPDIRAYDIVFICQSPEKNCNYGAGGDFDDFELKSRYLEIMGELGAEGWEAYAAIEPHKANHDRIFFKRPIEK